MTPFLSIVIPTYNEEKRLPQTLDTVCLFLKRQPFKSEVLVSDDGSQDRTVLFAREKLKDFPHQILTTPQNRGKGRAVRQGMLAAAGQYILFTDADLSTPIEEVDRFLVLLKADYDVVIGSRALKESRVEIHQNPLRELMGKAFNGFARMLAFKNIHDSQCGFKCFRREVARKLFSEQKLDGFSFDAEILFLAQKYGYRVQELPVVWRNSPQTRVQALRDPIFMFVDLLKIRRLHS